MKRFLQQSGISMVQGLVVGSVLAGSSLIATRLIQDQKKLQQSAESRDQIEQLHRMVFSVVQNREHCSATLLAGSTTPITGGALGQTNVINTIFSKAANGTSSATFRTYATDPTAMYMNNSVTIESMRLVFPSSANPTTETNPENKLSYPAKLQIVYGRNMGNTARRTGNGFGGKQIRKDIPILMQYSSVSPSTGNPTSGVISSCYAVQLGDSSNGIADGNNNVNQDFCSKLGENGSLYQWDSKMNKCVLKNNICPDKYVFAGILSNGNADCKPLSQYLGFMVDTTGSTGCQNPSQVRLEQDSVTGKVRIRCL